MKKTQRLSPAYSKIREGLEDAIAFIRAGGS